MTGIIARQRAKRLKIDGDEKMKIETHRSDMPQAMIKLVNDLVDTNEKMAIMAIVNAKKIRVVDPYKKEIINRAIWRGEEEIAKACDEMAEGRPTLAVRKLKVAWRHAQYAIFVGLEALGASKTKENGRKDMLLELKCFLSLPWIHFRRLIGLERKIQPDDGKKRTK
jgi:hypothetical protein